MVRKSCPPTRLLVAAIPLFVAGCARDEPPATGGPAKDSAETLAGLRAAKRELTLQLESDRATGLNQGSYQETIAKLERQEMGLRVLERIPMGAPTAAAFEAELQAFARANGVRVSRLRVDPRPPPPRRPLPTTVDRAFDWRDDDLVDTFDVSFRLETNSAFGLKRVISHLHELGRLLLVIALTEVPGGWDVGSEVYAFRDVTVPVHVPSVPPLDARLSRHGALRDAIASEVGLALLDDCESLDQALRAAQPAVQAALAPLTRAHYLGARFNAFRRRVERVEAQTAEQLLERVP